MKNVDPFEFGEMIDAGYGLDYALHVTRDRELCEESQVWADLDASVQIGARTTDEAEAEFLKWRDTQRNLGNVAARSQVDRIHSQQYSDNKRRMKRC